MAIIYLSVGSNVEPARHIKAGLQTLQQHYGELHLSAVYESPAVGFDGDNFYNLVLSFHSDEKPLTIASNLRRIEEQHGRVRGSQRFDSRTLDLDLILYDDMILNSAKLNLPRDEILKYAFVLAPLAELAPELIHPVTEKTYRELWESFAKPEQSIWKIAIDLAPSPVPNP